MFFKAFIVMQKVKCLKRHNVPQIGQSECPTKKAIRIFIKKGYLNFFKKGNLSVIEKESLGLYVLPE